MNLVRNQERLSGIEAFCARCFCCFRKNQESGEITSHSISNVQKSVSRFFIVLALVVLLAPISARAESGAGTLYGNAADCKQNVTPKGTFQYPAGVEKDSLQIIVDPKFNDKMKAERFTPDLPVTPVYDLAVEAVPLYSSCYTDTPEKFTTVPPTTLPFKVSIVADGQPIVNSGVLTQSDRKDDNGRTIYQWIVKGWPYGIADEAKVERLVEAIQYKKSVKISVDGVRQSDGVFGKTEQETSFNLCASLWGSGEHKVTFMRGASSNLYGKNAVHFFIDSKLDEENGFAVVEPFKSYEKSFSLSVDLSRHEDSSLLQRIASKEWYKLEQQTMAELLSQSSCAPTGIGVFHTGEIIMNDGFRPQGLAPMQTRKQIPESKMIILSHFGSPFVVLHELGHALAGLGDEADYKKAKVVNISAAYSKDWLGVQCSTNTSKDYSFGGKKYGASVDGCGYSRVKGGVNSQGQKYDQVFRPSETSIMNYGLTKSLGFNVVSCGWILAAIKGGDAHSYFPECAAMDGVIKDGVGQTASAVLSPFAALFSWVFNTGISPASLAAEANAALQIEAGKSVKVIVPKPPAPPAEFQPLASGEKVSAPETCLDASGRNSFATDSRPFEKRWASDADCAKNIATATTLQQKIDDLKTSIAFADALIESLAASKQEMSSVTSLRGDAVYTIPAGEEQEKTYTQVGKVETQCVSGVTVPLGVKNVGKGFALVSQSPEALAQLLAKARRINQEANATYLNALAKGGKAVSDSVRQIPLEQVTKLTETLGATFMPVSKGVLSRTYGAIESGKDFISVSMSLTLGATGAKQSCSSPYTLGGMVGKWFEGTITIDGLSYPRACIPEAHIIKKTNEGFDTNIAFFQKLKIKYQKALPPLQQQLAALAAKGYRCAAAEGTPVASAPVKIVRKSGTTPADRHAATEEGAAVPSGGAPPSSAEPSYLIAESFDPNNPWGEIIPVISDDLATSTATTTSAFATTTSTATTTLSFAATTAITTTATVVATATASSSPSILGRLGVWVSDTISGLAGRLFGTATPATTTPFTNTTTTTTTTSFLFRSWTRPPAESISSEISIPTLQSLNENITKLIEARKNVTLSSTGQNPIDSELGVLISEREKQLLELARTNPQAFLDSVLPEATRKILPQSLQNHLEQNGALTGTIEVFHADDFVKPQNSHSDYFLNVVGGNSMSKIVLKSAMPKTEHIQIYPTEDLPVISGARVRFKSVYRLQNVGVPDPSPDNLEVIETPKLESVGMQRLAIILVTFSDSPKPALSKEEIQKRVFEGSLNNFYKEQSYGKTFFTGDVYGWFTIDKPSENFRDGLYLTDPAIQQILQEQKVSLSGYEHVAIILNAPTFYGGMSTVGKVRISINGANLFLSQSWVGNFDKFGLPAGLITPAFGWDEFFDKPLVHEIGHSFGLPFHANGWYCGSDIFRNNCTREEYGNHYDVMGHGDVAQHFSAYFKEQLGWFDASQIVNISKPGDYTIQAYETKGGGAKIAKIFNPRSNGKSAPFYLEYRQPVGFDSQLSDSKLGGAHKEGVLINYIYDGSLYDQTSYVLDASPQNDDYYNHYNVSLPAGTTFLDKGRGIAIGPFTNATTEEVTFRVAFGEPECIHEPFRVKPRSSNKAVLFTGERTDYYTIITNLDSAACNPSKWTATLKTAELKWLRLESVDKNINPGEADSLQLSFFVSPDAPIGQYIAPIVFQNIVSKETVEVPLPIEVKPSALISSVSPATVSIGAIMTITGRGFDTNNPNQIFLTNQNGASYLVAEKKSPDGMSLTIQVPINANGVKLLPGSYVLSVSPPARGSSNSYPIDISAGSGQLFDSGAVDVNFEAANSFFSKPTFIATGVPVSLGEILFNVSEPIILDALRFRADITGKSGAVWNLKSLRLVSNDIPAIQGSIDSDGRIVFAGPFHLPRAITLRIEGVVGDNFSNGQTITLREIFWKDVEAKTEREERPVIFPKKKVAMSTMTVQKVAGLFSTENVGLKSNSHDVATSTVTTWGAGANPLNLSVITPTITGSPAGAAGTLYAGEMTLRSSILNQGADVPQTFNNVIQYRDAAKDGPWIDWVKFQVAGLKAGGKADIEHTWNGGAGLWQFRLVADSDNVVAESDERDNYSVPVNVSIVPRAGAVALPSAVSGAPKLILAAPVIAGSQAGVGALHAGSMTISEKVKNTGDGVAPPFTILFLYSQNDKDWNDWVHLDSLKLAPQAERTVLYNWNGGAGKWYFKACEDIKNTCSSPVLVEVI